jgi:hypothetical protein
MEKVDYTIGDDIVCVKTHSRGVVKENELYVARALKTQSCCSRVVVDVGVGVKDNVDCDICDCGSITRNIDSVWWLDAHRFKKLDSLVNIEELTEVLSETVPQEK